MLSRRLGRRIPVAVAAVALAWAGVAGGAPAHQRKATILEGTVSAVVDGDTIKVVSRGFETPVRLIGIDTPESVKPNTPVKCFGKEASKHTAELLPEGTPVRLVLDVEERDRYDRLLAYVYRAADGDFVNLTIARDGYAQQATFPPNVAHVDEFRAAVADARGAGRGLWSACRDDDPFAR